MITRLAQLLTRRRRDAHVIASLDAHATEMQDKLDIARRVPAIDPFATGGPQCTSLSPKTGDRCLLSVGTHTLHGADYTDHWTEASCPQPS